MFYVTLWLVMFIGWIALIAWGASMESRDRRRARAARQPAPISSGEEEKNRHPAHAHA